MIVTISVKGSMTRGWFQFGTMESNNPGCQVLTIHSIENACCPMIADRDEGTVEDNRRR